jgi:iron complex outermembrane receptor protein
MPASSCVVARPFRPLIAACISTTLWGGAVIGQTDTTQSADQTSAMLGEVVVTAQKRSEPIQRVPISIVAVTGEQMTQAGVSTLDELAGRIPAVQVQNTNNGATFFIRGIGDPGKSNGSSPVAVNLDGIYQSQQEVTGAALADLSRIEVLRGPQGTLYGRNATGGTVNIITNDPLLGEWSGEMQAGLGNYESRQLEGVINAPIGSTLAVRLVGSTNDHSGYLTNGLDDRHDRVIRVKALWQPSGRLRLLGTVQYLKIDEHGPSDVGLAPDGKTAGNLSWPPGGPTPVYTVSSNPWFDGPYNVETSGPNAVYCSPYCSTFYRVHDLQLIGQLDYDMGFGKLTAIAGSEQFQRDYLQFFAGYSGDQDPYHQESVEVRLANKRGSPIQWVAGVYALNQDGSGEVQEMLGIPQDSRNTVNTTQSHAAFGEVALPIGDRFRITAGMRYTADKVAGEVDTGALPAGNDGSSPTYDCYYPPYLAPGAACVNGVGQLFTFNHDQLTYKAGIQYDVAADSLLYADYSTGFRSGGVDGTGGPYGPETIRAYEIGSKNELLDRRLILNADVYYYLYGGYQLQYSRLIPGQTIAQSVESNVPGTSTVWGGELEGQYLLSRADRITLSAAYEASRFGSATVNLGNGPVDLAGETLPRMPKWTHTLGYEHTFTLPIGAALLAHVDGQYKSSYTTQLGPPPSYSVQRAYTLLNARLTYTSPSGRYDVSAYMNNITDKAVLLQSNPTRPPFGWGVLGDPRTYGVVFSEHFGGTQ